MATILPLAGAVLDRSALAAGFLAAAMAIGAFIARGQAIRNRASEEDVQRATSNGGFCGLATGAVVIGIDNFVG